MSGSHGETTAVHGAPATLDELRAEVDELRATLQLLTDRLGGRPEPRNGPPTSRRALLGLAGASAVGVLGAAASGRPVAAADPNDVVKNTGNPVVAATTLTGAFPTPIMGLFNNATSGDAAALYLFSQSAAAPTLRADNDAAGGLGGVALAGNAPGGRDVLARGSGRIAMVDHVFLTANQYEPGEIHQSGGTLFAMVGADRRQVVAAPDAVGAFTVIDPRRVYDTRAPFPQPGRLGAGESRVIPVADGRSVDTGVVTVGGLVPPDATAIMFNLTAVNTAGNGFLSVTPAPTTSISASTLNWIGDAAVVANGSVVGLVGREVRVHCGGSGSTDFSLDVVGYYR